MSPDKEEPQRRATATVSRGLAWGAGSRSAPAEGSPGTVRRPCSSEPLRPPTSSQELSPRQLRGAPPADLLRPQPCAGHLGQAAWSPAPRLQLLPGLASAVPFSRPAPGDQATLSREARVRAEDTREAPVTSANPQFPFLLTSPPWGCPSRPSRPVPGAQEAGGPCPAGRMLRARLCPSARCQGRAHGVRGPVSQDGRRGLLPAW